MFRLLILLLSFFLFISPVFAVRTDIDAPVTKRVLLVSFNPIIESHENKKLNEVLKEPWNPYNSRYWVPTNNTPDAMAAQFIPKLNTLTGGYINYTITDRIEIDGYPSLADGYVYTDETYLSCLQDTSSCHNPDTANVSLLLTSYGDICGRRNNNEIDEVWFFGAPYFGFPEWKYTGPNSTGFVYFVPGSSCQKLLPMMGFSYHVPYAEMIHNFGHRTEYALRNAYGGWRYGYSPDSRSYDTNWDRFTARIIHTNATTKPGCGNLHLPHNSTSTSTGGTDTSVTTAVENICNDFLNYPNLTGQTESFGCSGWQCNLACAAWGCNREPYYEWWFTHIPRYRGIGPDGKLNNWWKYVVDFDDAKFREQNPPLEGDENSDGKVNVVDLFMLLGNNTTNLIFRYGTVVAQYGRSQ